MMPDSSKISSFNRKDDPFLQRIKKDTAARHSQLEEQPLLAALMTPEVTPTQYRSYLERMQKITEAYEKKVLPLLATSQPTYAPTQLSSLLIAQDLQNLTPPNEVPVPLADFLLPQSLSLSSAWGFAYVMEGSKLGGKIIFKHLQKVLHLTEAQGAAYLANAGADTALDWKDFLQRLSAHAAANHAEDDVVNGAVAGFAAIGDYFEENRRVHAD